MLSLRDIFRGGVSRLSASSRHLATLVYGVVGVRFVNSQPVSTGLPGAWLKPPDGRTLKRPVNSLSRPNHALKGRDGEAVALRETA